jgi:hypothetical protein
LLRGWIEDAGYAARRPDAGAPAAATNVTATPPASRYDVDHIACVCR